MTTAQMTRPAVPLLASHGCEMPAIGFGTSQLGDCAELVATALKLGYRHIDTAGKYGSEKGVGEGLRASGVPRQEIFLCTKVSHEFLRADDYCRKQGLIFTAYCPLARGRMFSDPVLAEIANSRGRTIAQIALRWLMQQNVAAIPRSSNPERIAQNLDVFDFALSEEEMNKINGLKKADSRIANPAGRAPAWD